MLAALMATAGLVACERPTVVNTPPAPVAVPGPPGPPGEAGKTGTPGDTKVLVVPAPAASAASQ
jgi:hypothetical protein